MKHHIHNALILLLFVVVPVAQPDTYARYIATIPAPVSITSDIQPVVNDLISEVDKMLVDQDNDGTPDHLAPALFSPGYMAGTGFFYWGSPSELLSTLSGAYPYLPSPLQQKVKAYLDSEMSRYDPLAVSFYEPVTGKLSDQPGTRRELFPIDPSLAYNTWPGPTMSLQAAYGVWQYTYYTKDSRYLDTPAAWDSLMTLYNNLKSSGVKTYSDIVGLTGFSRLARMKGDTSLADEAAGLASLSLSIMRFSTFVANAKAESDYLKNLYPIFLDGCCVSFIGVFAPELGQYLHDHNLADLQNYSAQIEKYDPLWYMTLPDWGGDADTDMNRENLYAPPHIGWTNFMIHAYGFAESSSKLQTYLDFPSRLGDLFYIQELVATINRHPTS